MITLKWKKETPTSPWSTTFKGFYIQAVSDRCFKINESFTYNGRLENLITRLTNKAHD